MPSTACGRWWIPTRNIFDSVKSVVEGIKLYDKPICREDYGSVDYKDEFSSSIGKNDFTELGQIESQATQIMNSKYTGQSVSSVAPGSAKKVTEEEQFYAYLVPGLRLLQCKGE